ncbi:competence-damage inducible protein [Corynebacterium suranareeae]|uniref:Competence-damage inducible protein n=1 Tax=Corynebacterium suranareeae TaxID=2506452 RepID=A0A160PU99_9CORY|nr:CinA family protein [Corynebacterium suranareeae]BAU96671.1 competence-damage inducible protein [Corynebacterium suranareeae]
MTLTNVATQISELATHHGFTVAVAESLTGGKITSRLSAAPDSSRWLAGGIVCYETRIKYEVLGVPEGTPVITEAAVNAMVTGIADLMTADATVAVSGAGGPSDQEGKPPGTTWIAVMVRDAIHTELHHFRGEPEEILHATEEHALHLLYNKLVEACSTI